MSASPRQSERRHHPHRRRSGASTRLASVGPHPHASWHVGASTSAHACTGAFDPHVRMWGVERRRVDACARRGAWRRAEVAGFGDGIAMAGTSDGEGGSGTDGVGNTASAPCGVVVSLSSFRRPLPVHASPPQSAASQRRLGAALLPWRRPVPHHETTTNLGEKPASERIV